MTCFKCGGPLYRLGSLGQLNHFRCRHCGMDQASSLGDDIDPQDENEFDDYDADEDEDEEFDPNFGENFLIRIRELIEEMDTKLAELED